MSLVGGLEVWGLKWKGGGLYFQRKNLELFYNQSSSCQPLKFI